MRTVLVAAIVLIAVGSVLAVMPAAEAKLPCTSWNDCPLPDLCVPGQPCCHRWDACGPPPADP